MPRTWPLEPEQARARLCFLETTGRVSGEPHEIEIWFAVDDADPSSIYLLAGGRERADWVKNILKHPRVRLRIGRDAFAGAAALIDGGPRDPDARRALVAKYQPGYGEDLSDWSRTSLPVAITLDGYIGTV